MARIGSHQSPWRLSREETGRISSAPPENLEPSLTMKLHRPVRWVCFLFVLSAAVALRAAPDFPWLDELHVHASANPAGFRAELAARFHVGDAEVQAVIAKVPRPADAYLVFRFGELSGRPPLVVVEHYHQHRGQGWGVVAKELGIKPGSAEFHALKAGHDLAPGPARERSHGKKSRDGASERSSEAVDRGPGNSNHGPAEGRGPGEGGKGKGKGKDKN